MTDSNAFPSGGGGLFPALARYLFGDSAQPQQPQQAQPQRGLLGTTQPQVPSWDQANSDRSSFTGLLSGMLGHGIGPGIANAIMPDSMYAPQYNADLGGAQGVEMQRLGLPKARLLSDVFRGDIDPSTGQRIAPGESQFGAQQVPAAPAAVPASYSPATSQDGSLTYGGALAPPTPPYMPASMQAPSSQNAMNTAAPGVMPGAPASVPKLFEVPTPGGMSPQAALISSQVTPDLFKEFASGYFAPARENSWHVGDDGRLHYMPGGEKGIPVPPNDPNYQTLMAQQLRTQKGIEQNAILGRETALSDFNYRQKYGDLGSSPPAPGPLPPPQKTSNGFSIGGPAQNTTPAAPPKAGEPIDIASPSASMLIHTNPIKTQDGSIIPPLSEQGKLPSGSAAMDAAVPSWQARTDGWTNVVPLAQRSEHRLMVIADAFKKVQTGAWLTNKTEFGAILGSLGLDLGAKADDIGEVQKALHENYAETMGDLKAVTQKFTQMEFKVTSENKEHPNLQPSANLQMLGDDIGTLRQLQQLPTDFTRAQTLSRQWQNPAAFETAWLKANPLSKYSAAAMKEIGPLKGMPGNDGTPAAAASPPAAVKAAPPPDGSTKQIGKNSYIKKGGQWFPQ